MTSIFARLCFAAALVFGGLGVWAPVMAQAAPAAAPIDWTDAEVAELNAILKDVMVPMMNDLNTAVSLAQTDQPQACGAAKSASAKFADSERRLTALYAQLKAEGRDAARLDPIMAKMQEMKARMPGLVDAICSGALNQSSDPQVRAVQDRVMGLVRRYTNDMTAATNARAGGDQVTACASLKDGLAALDELEAYIKALAKTYGTTPADAAETQKMLDQIHQWQAQTRQTAQGCPAA